MEGMKVAHQDEKQDYERQLSELRSEYTKTKDELDGEIMVGLENINEQNLYILSMNILFSLMTFIIWPK